MTVYLHLRPTPSASGAGFAGDFRGYDFFVDRFGLGTFGARIAAEDGFFYQLENGPAIFQDDFWPSQFPHHGEIDAAETDARQENVDAVAERLVVERVDGV